MVRLEPIAGEFPTSRSKEETSDPNRRSRTQIPERRVTQGSDRLMEASPLRARFFKDRTRHKALVIRALENVKARTAARGRIFLVLN